MSTLDIDIGWAAGYVVLVYAASVYPLPVASGRAELHAAPSLRRAALPLTVVCVAWITEPDPRNSNDLKKAWVRRWNIAAVTDPSPSATNINPSCDTVEYASTFLMSF